MKTFIILTGKTLTVVEDATRLDAMDRAVNMFGANTEIIVREIDDVLGAAQLRKYL